MSRILPYPLLTLMLLVMWLLLQQSLGLGQILLGLAVSMLASIATAAMQLEKPHIRHPLVALRLLGRVSLDVARSNIAVGRIILGGAQRQQTSAFLHLPLQLTDRHGLAVLACIITATPGSAWLEYDAIRGTVLIHVLDLVDEAAWIETIKTRYETLLLEIFQ